MSTSLGSGGSPPHSRIGRQMQNEAPQVALHSDGVDQPVHDANCVGHVLDAWQVPAVDTIASRIASGSLLSAAFSIAGVGAIIARLRYSGVSTAAGSSGSTNEAVASGARPVGGPWPAASHAHRPHAIAMTKARVRMVMMSSSMVRRSPIASPDTLGPIAGTAGAKHRTQAATARLGQICSRMLRERILALLFM